MGKKYLFTSESVSEGHPDKVCDQVSDAILDECLKIDSNSHVACETFATTNFLAVCGEISCNGFSKIDVEKIARDVVLDIGYNSDDFGFNGKSLEFMNRLHAQSSDINQGVVGTGLEEYKGLQGAGDQGLMFGFACKETPELMPATLIYSHKMLQKATELRKNGSLNFLRPDAKAQVTIEYEGHQPKRIDTVVISHQHNPSVSYKDIKESLIECIVKPTLEPTGLLDKNTKYYVNPTGNFVIGGPDGDTGLTGRKIIVDTYGGMGRHGGGAFSGKDPSKVDRSAAYMARYIAKNIVAAGFAERAEVQLAYAIGVPYPVSIMVDTFGSSTIPEARIEEAVKKVFDCTPAGIIKTLNLASPIYRATSNYGHFGRDGFSWEKTDKIEDLKKNL